MQTVVWILRFVIVVVLVWFAVKNAQVVTIYGLPGQEWQAPFVFVLLVVFVAGMIIGLLAWVPTVVRPRPQIRRLKKIPATPVVAPPPSTAQPPHGA